MSVNWACLMPARLLMLFGELRKEVRDPCAETWGRQPPQLHPCWQSALVQDSRRRAQVTFILLGKYLEASAKGRTSEAIQALLTLAPPTALLLEGGDAEGGETVGSENPSPGKGSQDPAPATEREVPTALIHRGDRLKVRLERSPGKTLGVEPASGHSQTNICQYVLRHAALCSMGM